MENTDVKETTPCIKRRVNWDLLPIKLHFVLLYGAAGGVITYLPVLGKQLGLSPTALGLVYTAQPIAILFAKPAFGILVDYTRNLRMVMLFLTIIQGISYVGILFISPVVNVPSYEGIVLTCFNSIPLIRASQLYNQSCIEFHLSRNITCEFQFASCEDFNYAGKNSSCNTTCSTFRSEKMRIQKGNYSGIHNDTSTNGTYILNFPEDEKMTTAADDSQLIHKFYSRLSFANLHSEDGSSNETYRVIHAFHHHSACDCGDSNWKVLSCNDDLKPCLTETETAIYKSYQFWVFAILVIISGSCSAALFTLSDAACYEMLGERTDLYGIQRLFGTISWGIVSLLAGALNEAAKTVKIHTDYEAGFYLAFIMQFLDIIVLIKMSLKKANFTSSICKDVSKIFTSFEILAFTLAVFVVGGLSGLLWNYELWFLENLGASQLIMGLAVAVQCIVAEVPFFILSNWMISKFGHFLCLVGSFAAYFLRYVLYYFLKNPWLILPIDLLHGQTYAAFYATMVSFGKIKAPPGTEATMLGLLGGVFEGLGVGAGSLLGGLGFDILGDRLTFLDAGLLSGIFAIIYLIIRHILKYQVRSGKNNTYGANPPSVQHCEEPQTHLQDYGSTEAKV